MSRDKSRDLVEDVFTPGEAHLIGGAPGSGKTAFESWLCGAVLRGEPFLDQPTHRPPWWGAIIIDRGMEARLRFWRAAGITGVPYKAASGAEWRDVDDKVHYYCLTEDADLNPSTLSTMIQQRGWDPIRFLENRVKAMSPPEGGVITVDVANFFGADSKFGYERAFVSGWGLNRIAKDFGITILALMHGGKQKKHDTYARLVDRIIAGSGFIGAVGTSSYLTSYQETDEGGLQEFEWQSHLCAPARFKLRRTTDGLFEVVQRVELFGTGAETKDGFPPAYSERWDDYLPWFPPEGAQQFLATMTIMDKGTQLGHSKRTIERDLMAMERAGVIVRFHGTQGRWQRRQVVRAQEE